MPAIEAGASPAGQQNVHASGQSTVTAVAGDYRVETHVHTGVAEFQAYDLGSISADGAPRSVARLAGRLRQHTILVLAGDYEDKPMVARHVAARLARDEAAARPAAGAPEVLQWVGGNDLQSLLRGLYGRERPAVVLLNRIHPQQVDWNLARLCAAARERGHHVVATTDLGRERWHLGAGEAGFWHQLGPGDLPDTGAVVTLLLDELKRANGRLPDGLLREEYEPARSELGGVALGDIAARLRTHEGVRRFGELLRTGVEAHGAAVEVRALVARATSAHDRVDKWFNTRLGDDGRVLALGLSFFGGLADDQFFAALERWVKHIRDRRDPRMRAFDYADVTELEFFDRVETENGGVRFDARLDDQRRLVFEAAWRSHRRQLVGALEVLTGLALESADDRAADVELYGSEGRRWQVRRAVAEALGDVGVLSSAVVEPALLRLAGDDDGDVQSVAAAAMARWRGQGRNAEFFATLGRWQRDARVMGLVEAMLEGHDEKRSRGAHARIRATIALAVGYASDYDPPNRLTPELVRLLEELARDRNRLVRKRFAEYTLPHVVRLHLAQLRPALHEMARSVELAHPIGLALAHAARTVPGEVTATLDAWHAECATHRPTVVDRRRVSHRDVLMMALAYTWGELAYDDEGAPLTAEAGFARLKEILAREPHPRVRSAAIVAMGRQAATRFAWVEPLLQRLVGELAAEEVDDVVRVLVDVYLAQRRALSGGDDTIEVKGERYAIWIGRPRPLTDVEVAMLRWLADGGHPAGQRIAVLANVAFFESLDRVEAREIDRRRAERRRDAEADAAARITTPPARWAGEPGWYTGTFVPWLATLGSPTHFPVVRGVLGEALAQRAARPAALDHVVRRWQSMSGDGETRELARQLRGAMAWHGAAWLLLLLGAFFFVFLLVKIF